MIEFLCGLIIGVWMGQQLPLPSVQQAIQTWWNNNQQIASEANTDEVNEEDEAPLFTGEIPTHVPGV